MHIFFNSPYGNMLKNLYKVLPSSSSRRVRNSAESKYADVPSHDDNKNTVKPMKELGNLCHTSYTTEKENIARLPFLEVTCQQSSD